jgi:hypothetical protein
VLSILGSSQDMGFRAGVVIMPIVN